MFSSWYEGVHVIWLKLLEHFWSLFPHCELSHFSPSICRQWIYKQLVPLVSATPLTVLYRLLWNFACVFFMVWGCACDLDVIVRLFFSLFPHCELIHYSPAIYKWVPREHNSSYNFILIFLELCTCFLHSLKMCMCFSYNPCHIFFSLFCSFWTLSFTDLRCIDNGYHVIATSHTILNRSFWNFAHVFSWVCRSACGLDMILFLFLSLFPL